MPLQLLYEPYLLEHYKNPRNFSPIGLSGAGIRAENPSCGDFIELQLEISQDMHIVCVRFYGRGCAISQASASMMTECIKGMPIRQAAMLDRQFRGYLAGEVQTCPADELAVFAALREFPLRVKCALLGWDALHQHLARIPSARKGASS